MASSDSNSLLHIVGVVERIDVDAYRYCFPGFADDPPAERPASSYLRSGPEDTKWRLRFDDGAVLDCIQWETPKRTRTYPLSRTYRLLQSRNRRVAVIPAVKDEGSGQNPDVIGIETLALLCMVGVYPVTTAYVAARAVERATPGGASVRVLRDQTPDRNEVATQLATLTAPEVTPSVWTQGEIDCLEFALERSARAYAALAQSTGVRLSTVASCRRRIDVLRSRGLKGYIEQSDRYRRRSQQAEVSGLQPKEHLALAARKVRVDIELRPPLSLPAPLFMHLAPDEGWLVGGDIIVVEKKSNPSTADMEDALFKNLLYQNLRVRTPTNPVAFAIGLTYDRRSGACWSSCPHFGRCEEEGFTRCYYQPLIAFNQRMTFADRADVRACLREGRQNGFLTFVIGCRGADRAAQDHIQTVILQACIDQRRAS